MTVEELRLFLGVDKEEEEEDETPKNDSKLKNFMKVL